MTIPVPKDPLHSAFNPRTVPSFKIAAAYARVESLHEHPSEYKQILQCRAFALEFGFVLEAIYTDYGLGAIKMRRKGLDKLLQAAVGGHFQFIIMTDYSRMFESERMVEEYQDFLWRRSRVDLIFLDEVRRWLG